MPSPSSPVHRSPLPGWPWALLVVSLGTISQLVFLQSCLEDFALARQMISRGLWEDVVSRLGGKIVRLPVAAASAESYELARFDGSSYLLAGLVLSGLLWLVTSGLVARRRGDTFERSLRRVATRCWPWWLLPGLWEVLRLTSSLVGWNSLQMLIEATPHFCLAATWSGWFASVVHGATTAMSHPVPGLSPEAPQPGPQSELAAAAPGAAAGRSRATGLARWLRSLAHIPRAVWIGVALYTLCFGVLNSLLYAALQIPHGDSAMYEEHLWNLLHGKGFRSYLDNGRLFLGEHVQIIHLYLIPLYLVWPSHLLLEWCQSLALALGALPAFTITHRHTGSRTAAICLAAAYLLYAPLQFLDIAIDIKTFRPNAFEIPLLLFALEAWEQGRWKTFGLLLLVTLSAQEDAAVVLAPLGVWIALCGPRSLLSNSTPFPARSPAAEASPDPFTCVNLSTGPNTSTRADAAQITRDCRWRGLLLAVAATAYVILVIAVILPSFRRGQDVHFASYFSELGDSSGGIVKTVLTQPGRVLARWFSLETATFALALLAPLGGLSLLSPSRLAVAFPLFAVLCLNNIARNAFHHFHAPLVPILIWSAAAGLGRVRTVAAALSSRPNAADLGQPFALALALASRLRAIVQRDRSPAVVPPPSAAPLHEAVRFAGLWCVGCAFGCGVWLTFTPLGIGFWDPSARIHWRRLYVPDDRARYVPHVLATVPPSSRVASTDFIHPRFTHHERSYDYSDYRPIVPDDTDYIVIDTQHPYSQIKTPADVKELRDHPDRWELVPDQTRGYYIILRRKRE